MKRSPDMYDQALPLTFLKVGEGGVFNTPCRVETILGSCVSVTLHCRRQLTGGIFHALMPVCREAAQPAGSDVFRFVDLAVARLFAQMTSSGCRRGEIEAKIFGGASSLFTGGHGVGPSNVLTALEILESLGLRVLASDVGGNRGRKLVFLPHTGEVFLKRLSGPEQLRS